MSSETAQVMRSATTATLVLGLRYPRAMYGECRLVSRTCHRRMLFSSTHVQVRGISWHLPPALALCPLDSPELPYPTRFSTLIHFPIDSLIAIHRTDCDVLTASAYRSLCGFLNRALTPRILGALVQSVSHALTKLSQLFIHFRLIGGQPASLERPLKLEACHSTLQPLVFPVVLVTRIPAEDYFGRASTLMGS